MYSEIYFNQKWTVKIRKYHCPFYDRWDHEIFIKYLKFFQLPYKNKIKTFSTGMKMKLSLAIAFSHHAELFILDEPTSGLDPLIRNELLEIIQQELIDENKTVFFSTHIISDLEKLQIISFFSVRVKSYSMSLGINYRKNTKSLVVLMKT